ncbi:MAG: 3-deoxy-D-manno-octulosonic acid transferase [Chitinophagaceae bacterium]
MKLFFYNIFLLLFKAAVPIAALFNGKAQKWVRGRSNIFGKLETAIAGNDKIIWIHCASLGEFEQGRPVIDQLRIRHLSYKLLLTFFSPSGYEIRKNYDGVDWVFYLPADGPQNAKRFMQIIKPSLVIFVKYEFWYYYLKEIKKSDTPLLLISALFREGSIFFKWYGGLQRKMLSFFDHLFVQNETSKKLLDSIGFANISSVCGDTRFDRVIEIAEKFTPIPAIEKFLGNHKTLVAGSTWPQDEQVLQKAITTINDPSLKLIIAPHEINKEHIAQVQKLFPDSILYSQLTKGDGQQAIDNKQLAINNPSSNVHYPNILISQYPNINTLIIDNIGILSRLYYYAYITYTGGGFGKGIHNTLEAAVYGKPVLFGPVYNKFQEAIDLINNGGAISINNSEDCISAIQKLIQDDNTYAGICEKSKGYVYANSGATKKIMNYIQEKRLLTN